MKPSNLSLIAGLIIIYLIFAAVPASAETFEETYTEDSYSLTIHSATSTGGASIALPSQSGLQLVFPDAAENYAGLYFISLSSSGHVLNITRNDVRQDVSNIKFHTDNGLTGLFSAIYSNVYSQGAQVDIWFHFDNYTDIRSLPSQVNVTFDDPTVKIGYFLIGQKVVAGSLSYTTKSTDTPLHRCGLKYINGGYYHNDGSYLGVQVACLSHWENSISAEYGIIPSEFSLYRSSYYSTLYLYDADTQIYTNYDGINKHYYVNNNSFSYKIVTPAGNTYQKNLIPEETGTGNDTISILASVKNIQDYSVIGDSTISFVSDTENITRTMPNGYDLFTLAKNTWYNVSASADGFTAQQEYESNLWTGNSAIDVWMIPITEEESNETVQMNWYVSESNPAGPGTLRISDAVISINSKTILTDSSGYASTILNRSGSISYTVKKDGYNTYSRSFSPNWETYTFPTIDEHITLLKIGESIGEVTPEPTPDTRTSNQKAESAFNILFDNLESIVQLAVLVLIISLIGMLAGGGKKR